MEQFKNFATIEKQSYINEYEWNGVSFYCYMIKFEEHDGLFKISRANNQEQALIGAKIQFNVSDDFSRVSKYRIVGFKENKENQHDKIKVLMEDKTKKERR
jgi:hypothetical protein